ncbi:MAG TPA: DUF3035 domain-containing protein [Caulobacteraceae bacterium]|jgi:hypothetical protein|nr:DUF3035 domain-containing protein [Caulobacteraceae bacterium]
MHCTRVVAAAALIAAAGLSGCDTASRAFGLAKVTPDEFRVVTKAPLTLPPDYSLRPPAPGEPRPQELQPESAARQALVGQRAGDVRSDGERLFVSKAGADHADPLVRYVVDDEFGNLAHKDKSFADYVMFWKKGEPAAAPASADADQDQSQPIDPATEEKRLQALTGGKTIVIARKGDSKVKLPGL